LNSYNVVVPLLFNHHVSSLLSSVKSLDRTKAVEKWRRGAMIWWRWVPWFDHQVKIWENFCLGFLSLPWCGRFLSLQIQIFLINFTLFS
jgi:hypothetical protein